MSAAELRVLQLRGAVALAGRESRRVLSLWTQTILPAVATAALFLAVFGGALASRIDRVEGLPYLTFILPGLLVTTVAVQSFANTSTSLFQAKSEGYLEDVLSSPLRPWQLALAYMSGGLLRAFAAAGAVLLLALPFADVRIRPATLAAALLLTGLVFSTVGVITGIWADTFDQHAFVANIVVTPLALLGGVFYPADSLAEPWATLTRLDPLTHLVDAARGGLAGVHESPAWLSLLVAAGAAAAAFGAAVALVARGWRLKP